MENLQNIFKKVTAWGKAFLISFVFFVVSASIIFLVDESLGDSIVGTVFGFSAFVMFISAIAGSWNGSVIAYIISILIVVSVFVVGFTTDTSQGISLYVTIALFLTIFLLLPLAFRVIYKFFKMGKDDLSTTAKIPLN